MSLPCCYGLGTVVRTRDKNIYLPCIGWNAADSAVIAGTLIYG
jgi:hypothetical protein